MNSGIILLDKAAGLSSAAALAKVKKKLGLKKAGHAGTLDPMATGLLVCLAGGATRLASFAEKGRKRYSGTIKLGITTDTEDKEGQVLSESSAIPEFSVIKEAAIKYKGEIMQIPPQISAVKVGGERAYRLARRGEAVALNERAVQIFDLQLEEDEKGLLKFIVECSSGTYIRSIARDLGKDLGCGACLWSLRREYSYPFSVTQAKTIEDINEQDIFDWQVLFPDMAVVSFDAPDAKRLQTGDIKSMRSRLQKIITPQVKGEPRTVLYCERTCSKPLGMLQNVSGVWEIGLNLS